MHPPYARAAKSLRRLAALATLFLVACSQTPEPPPDYLERVETPPVPEARLDTLADNVIRINAGGPELTLGGVTWSADQYYSGGNAFGAPFSAVSNTDDDPLYVTERSSSTDLGSFSYDVPLMKSGVYEVKLHFAETYWGAPGGGPGGAYQRVLSANMEGGGVELPDYDIFAEVGAAAAVVKTFAEVPVRDGELNIVFSASVNRPKLSALEVSFKEDLPPIDTPTITGTSPTNGATGVFRNTAVTAELFLVNGGLDLSTVNINNVQLRKKSSGALVPGTVNSSGGADTLVYQPSDLLELSTEYVFTVTSGLKDVTGESFEPYTMSFTTGTTTSVKTDPAVNFEKKTVYQGSPNFSLTVGPDGKLYGAGFDGVIRRWTIQPNGDLSNLQEFNALAGRTIIGLTFDPDDPDMIWVTNNAPLFPFPGEDFTGKITRIKLSGSGFSGTAQDYVVGLPRSGHDHLSNSLEFGPDGMLYMPQGGNTSLGDPDAAWYYPPRAAPDCRHAANRPRCAGQRNCPSTCRRRTTRANLRHLQSALV